MPPKTTSKKPAKSVKPSKPSTKKAPAKAAKPVAKSKAAQKSVVAQSTAVRAKAAKKEGAVASYAEPALLSAGWVAAPKQTFERNDIIKLVFAYLWRSWLLAFTWGMVSATLELAVNIYNPPYGPDAWLMGLQGLDMLVSFGISLAVFAWLQSEPKLLGGVRLAASVSKGGRWRQVVTLWFSFTWRNVLWFFAGMVSLMGIKVISMVITPTFPFISMVLLWGGIACALVYFFVLVPYLVWRQLLKRQTFSWGKLELLRVKS